MEEIAKAQEEVLANDTFNRNKSEEVRREKRVMWRIQKVRKTRKGWRRTTIGNEKKRVRKQDRK